MALPPPRFGLKDGKVVPLHREQSAAVFSGPRLLRVAVTTAQVGRQDLERTRGKKRAVEGFSTAARHNLSRCLALVSSPHPLSHITLTYRDEFPRNAAELLDEKRMLCMAAARAGLYGVWRLEFHRSEKNTEWGMVPHWHCLLYSRTEKTSFITQFAPTAHALISAHVNKAVSDFVGWFRRNRNAHVRGSHVTNGNEASAAWYMAAHSIKGDQSPPFKVGKWWGYIAEAELKKWQRLDEVAQGVSPAEIIWFKRLQRKKANAERRAKGLPRVRPNFGGQTGINWFLREADHAAVIHAVADLAQLPLSARASRPRRTA